MRVVETGTRFQLEWDGGGNIQNRFWNFGNIADNWPWVSENTVHWFLEARNKRSSEKGDVSSLMGMKVRVEERLKSPGWLIQTVMGIILKMVYNFCDALH